MADHPEPRPDGGNAASSDTPSETGAAVAADAAAVEAGPAETDSAHRNETAAVDEPEGAGASANSRDTNSFEPSPIDLDLDADPRAEFRHGDEEYAKLLSMYEDTLSQIAEGEIVTAQVIGKTETDVILDVGFKSEGAVPLDEFQDPDDVRPGDSVDVLLESLEDENGVVVLSKKKADFLRVWEKIKDAFDNNRPVRGRIKRQIKGGVTVDLMGVDAFLPGSQIALRRVPNVDDLIGEEDDFKILKLNKRRRNIVISRRVLLEEERAGKREELKKELSVGDVRAGIVKNITDFGAFIDLGGMDGLLHITDMSWGRIGRPSEVCDIGQTLEVKILDIDWDRERISLGLKQLQEYPWKNAAEKYSAGTRVLGRVVSITNYGAFIELEHGIEGLVHISEMSWTRNVRHPSQLVGINDKVECVVLRVDEKAQKISLGMKQIEEDPWLALPAQYPPGTKIKGVVRNLTSFGAFVEVQEGIDGLVHISDMSWTRRIQHPTEVLRRGEKVEVTVLSIDPGQKRISLGLKQVQDDPWYELAQEYTPGREVEGAITHLLAKGVLVDLGDDVTGFVPISQLGVKEHISEPGERFSQGQKLTLRILETDPVNRRIVLAVVGASEIPYDPAEVEYEEGTAEPKPESAATGEGEQLPVPGEISGMGTTPGDTSGDDAADDAESASEVADGAADDAESASEVADGAADDKEDGSVGEDEE